MIGRAFLVALLATAATASPASAQAPCTAPDEPGWRSCLTVSHRAIQGSSDVHVTAARPRLIQRYADGCAVAADRRRVVVRTGAGARLGALTVRSRCRRGVARWNARLQLDVDLPAGTVVRSLWSGIADAASAPRVRLRVG
ncbi:MAG TPA: hypothetical protein VFX80_04200 [Solirubrobacteraceae bacterium]|nr:hypothetical protein [Solirubrobacteraceae bacterium]